VPGRWVLVWVTWVAAGLVSAVSRSRELSEWLLASLGGGLLSLEKRLSLIPSNMFKMVFLESL